MSLLFTILLYVIYASNSQTICIWGASETNQMLNGEYTYHCCINGQSYYRTTVDSSCSINGKNTFYLYNYNNILWLIGDAVGSTSAFATCQSSSVSPTDCSTSGKWIAGFGNSNVEVTSGSCPQSNCGIIATSFPSNNICATTFNQKIDVNQWEGYNEVAQQYVYFYFAPQWFKWVCADHVDEGCNIHYHDKSEAVWNIMYQGSSTDVRFDNIASTQTIYCNAPTRKPTTAKPSVAPTLYPSMQPTTSFPSLSPTFGPSTQPTTSRPSIHPSAFPSHTPTFGPSMQPTSLPSIHPSAFPSHSPTFEPTAVPTTGKPTDEPTGTPTYTPPISSTSDGGNLSRSVTDSVNGSQYTSIESNQVVLVFIIVIAMGISF
eukprot:755080_1